MLAEYEIDGVTQAIIMDDKGTFKSDKDEFVKLASQVDTKHNPLENPGLADHHQPFGFFAVNSARSTIEAAGHKVKLISYIDPYDDSKLPPGAVS